MKKKYVSLILLLILTIKGSKIEEDTEENFKVDFTCIYKCKDIESNATNSCISEYFTLKIEVDKFLKENISSEREQIIIKNICTDEKFYHIQKAIKFCKLIKCGNPDLRELIVFRNKIV